MTTELKQKLAAGLALQQDNQIAQAIAIYEDILRQTPSHAETLQALGLAYAQQHQFSRALPFLQQAVQADPSVAQFHNNLANAYKQCGQVDKALQHYHEALRLKPIYPQVHNNLGTLLYQLGKYEEAADHFQKSLRMDPQAIDTHYNLANCYVQQNKLLEATTHFREVLKSRPEHLSACHNLGIIYCNLKHFQEAQSLLSQVVLREPNNKDAWFHLGVAYSALGQAEPAQHCYEQVLNLEPDHAHSHHNLATLYLHAKQPQEALKHFRQALKLEPNNKTAQHMIDALTGQPNTQGAPLEYTRALFDQYASSYNEQVKSQLKYNVPTLLREMLSPFIKDPHPPWQALDLGCGTGLCAPLFADLVAKLIGVDLSSNMIEIARQQGGYYRLYTQDILSFLDHAEPVDLIICADVLVYFGDLNTLFAACQRTLKPEGFWCFSIEHLSVEDRSQSNDFQLQKTGRYAHPLDYIQRLSQRFGFEIKAQQQAIIRYQEDQPVVGDLFILQNTLK